MRKIMWRHVVVIHFLFAILRTGGVHGQQLSTTAAGNVSGSSADTSSLSNIITNSTSPTINSSTGSSSVISTSFITVISPSDPRSSSSVSSGFIAFVSSANTSSDSVTTQVPVSSNVSLVDLQAVQILQALFTRLLGYNLPVDQNVFALFGQVLAGNTPSLDTNNVSIHNPMTAFAQNGSTNLGAILGPLSSGGSLSSPLEVGRGLLNSMLQSQLANLPETFSPQCRSDMEEFQNGLNRLDMWTIQMLDAMGKPQAGMLKGQKTFVGQYDECREISHETQSGHVIQGQFCTPQVMLDFSSLGALGPLLTMLLSPIYMDVCLPASCTDADVFMLFESALENLGAKLTAASCVKDKDPSTDAAFWVAIALLGVLVVLCTWGTCYSVLLKRNKRKEEKYQSEMTTTTNGHVNAAFDDGLPEKAGNDVMSPTDPTDVNKVSSRVACDEGLKIVVSEPENLVNAQKTKPTGLGGRLLLCFSVLDNGRKLLDCSRRQADLSCLHGMRVISITWVVLGHCFSSFVGATGNTLDNLQDLGLMVNTWTMMPLVSGTLSVDTFFVISGCLTSYIFLRQAQKGTGISCRTMALYYLHRFWRLTPLYMMSLLFYVGILPYLTTGPYDNSERQDLTICRSRWWLNLLYVNNIVEADKMCFGWSWYLANDMQFYIIAPLALLPWFFGKKIIGILVCLGLVAGHIISNGVIIHRINSTFLSQNSGEFMKNVYFPPWTRMGPFFIGLLLGYALHLTSSKYKIRRMFAALGWLVATAAGFTCVYIMFDNVKNFHKTFQVFWNIDQYTAYETLSRPAWACAVAWVIFACCSGSGGFVNTFLSWSGWTPLSRLTYGVYLFHLITFYVLLANRITPFHASAWTMTDMTISVTVLTFMVSFVFSLLVESPTLGLEKVLLGGAGGKKNH